MIGAGRLYGILGWPVRHSLSPALQEAAFRAAGVGGTYGRFPVPPDRLPHAVGVLRRLRIAGGNVTAPHKVEMLGLLDEVDGEARAVGAVNTFTRRGAALVGTNTDAEGFRVFLAEDARFPCPGASVLILGSGGAARACALALGRSGIARIVVAARRPDRGEEVLALAGTKGEVVPWKDAARRPADLIVNATPLGWRGETVPVEPEPGQVVVDLVYRPTPLLAAARARGAAAFDGRGMLVRQAALSFESWTGRGAPIEAMRQALDTAIES